MPIRQEVSNAIRAYIDGQPLKDILARYCIRAGTLYYALDKARVPRRQRHPSRRSGRHWKMKRQRRRAREAVERAMIAEFSGLWRDEKPHPASPTRAPQWKIKARQRLELAPTSPEEEEFSSIWQH